MKKITIYILLVLVMGCIIGYTLKPVKSHPQSLLTEVLSNIIAPATAFADSDTLIGLPPKPPPPPIK